jgi:nucleoside-diphosphate-sugar epimerase
MEKDNPKVCITGISGFLGSWVLKRFLDCEEPKFDIRGTVRDPENKSKIQPLHDSLGDSFEQVELVAADLLDADSIDKAIEGCDYVVHTASPFPAKMPKHEDDLIKPAVGGTRAVLEACKKHKVKKLVVTSSVAAILDYSKYEEEHEVDEESWLEDFDNSVAYPKSKTLAERLVWEFTNDLSEDDKFDAVTINPGFILGPILGMSESDTSLRSI